jgi:diaminopimelate decarboxylase
MWIQKLAKRIASDELFPRRTHAFVVCSSEVRRVVSALHAAFPQKEGLKITHAFAAKANPLFGVLTVVRDAGMGCETASLGELTMALRVFPPEKIIFDSPCKTHEELGMALRLPCFVNLDNFDELDRVSRIIGSLPEGALKATVGLRINPQLGYGSNATLSTGTKTSKFGIGLDDCRAKIVAAFKSHSFLSMLHVHTGSQGIGLRMMVDGVKAIVDLAEEIGPQVQVIDMGGGLPVNFASDEYKPSVQSYVAELQTSVPLLLSGRFHVITEFGRSIIAKAGVLASRVEYAKENGGRRIIQQHIGADLAVRTAWAPKDWPLRVDIFDKRGELKTDDVGESDVAGPCCFGGDLICSAQRLPRAVALEDFVVVKDVGGYYHSSFSYYNLRQPPPCFIYDEETDILTLINRGRTVEETVDLMMA